MKKLPTFEELKENAIESNKKMSWFSEKFSVSSLANFDFHFNDCCCKLRRNSVFLTRYVYNTTSVITDNFLISDYEYLISKRFDKSGISASCIQDISHIIFKMIMEPNYLSLAMQNYFNQNFDEAKNLKKDFDHTDFFIFTHCTFPAIFGYFMFPDVMQNAVSLIKFFFFYNNYEFASHLICAFFENTPNFLDTLFTLYDEKKFLENKKKTAMKFFNFFIESLEVATCILTPYHRDIIESVLSVGNHIFLHTFVDKLFLSQVKLRNPKDILIQILKFILEHENSAPFQVLLKTLAKPKFHSLNELTVCGGLYGLNIQYYPAYISGYEIKLLLNLTKDSHDPKLYKKITETCTKKAFSRFTSMQLKIYPKFKSLMESQNNTPQKLLIFPPFKRAIFKRVNEEYRRSFNNIQSYATTSEVDQIMFYVPELINSSCANKVRQVVTKMHWENQDNFLKFAYMELSNQYAESASQFERMVSLIFCQDYWEKIEKSANSLFECQIGTFKFDKNLEICNDFAFRKKMAKFNYNEIEPFNDMTNSFRLAFDHLNNVEIDMYNNLRSRLRLLETTKSYINHILQTSISYIIRRIPFYLDQLFEIAKDIAGTDEIRQYKCFFMILFSVIDTWKIFFDAFCIFFSIFAKEVSDSSVFANNIKKSWEKVRNCFQVAVYEEAPSVKEYINSLLY